MYLTSCIKSLIVSLTILTLTTLVSVNSLAETATSGNLLPNAGDGVNTGVQNSNSTIDGLDSASGFTLNGIQDFTSQYKELEAKGLAELTIFNGVGVEKFAEHAFMFADELVHDMTDGRCRVVEVECAEHGANSAIYRVG